jgi:hypothetical protein
LTEAYLILITMTFNLIRNRFYSQNQSETQNITILGIVISVIILLPLIVSRIVYPFDLGVYESHTWESALLTASGLNPYAYAMQPPYVVSAYGYFYYLIIGTGLKLFGLQFWFGRVFTVLAAVVCVICVGKIVYLITNKKSLMYLAMFSVLVSSIFQSWIAVHRADFPSLAFAFLGLTITINEVISKNNSIIRCVSVVLCLSFSLFCKHTTILPFIIIIAAYVQARMIKQALVVFFSVAVIGIILASILNYTSNGGYYFQHFQITQTIPYNYYRSIEILKYFCLHSSNYIIFPIIILGIYKILRIHSSDESLNEQSRFTSLDSISSKITKTPVSLFIIYLILSFILSFYTSARSGSSTNYYLECTLVTSILFGLALDKLQFITEKRTACTILISLFVLFFLIQSITSYRGEYFRWESLPYYKELVQTLNESVPEDGLSISSYPDLIALTGRKYEFGDISQYADGRSPELQQILRKSVQSNRYSAIILIGNDTKLPEDCHNIPMKHAPPTKFYAVYLYVCNTSKTEQ